jgi:hypothetical protein
MLLCADENCNHTPIHLPCLQKGLDFRIKSLNGGLLCEHTHARSRCHRPFLRRSRGSRELIRSLARMVMEDGTFVPLTAWYK